MLRTFWRDERGIAPLLTVIGTLLMMGVVGGGAAVYDVAATQATLKRAAQAVVEGEKQNGCYDAGTEQAVQDLVQRSGLDPARVALRADTAKQGYGSQVSARVEYVKPVSLIGINTPYQVRIAAEAADVSAHVAPVRNAPCKAPAFAQATGRSGFENAQETGQTPPAGGPALAANPSGDSNPAPGTGAESRISPAADPNCKQPVTLTRTVTKYREETYQEQVGTKEETRYREETYQEPVQKTRTVTKYRDEKYTEDVKKEEKYFTFRPRWAVPDDLSRYNFIRVGIDKANGTVKIYAIIPKPGGEKHEVKLELLETVDVKNDRKNAYDYRQYVDLGSKGTIKIPAGTIGLYVEASMATKITFELYEDTDKMMPRGSASFGSGSRDSRPRVGIYVRNYIMYSEIPSEKTRVELTEKVTKTRQVPYQDTETYVVNETRTRQVPYTVEVPVYETRIRQVPYQDTETYTDYVPCGLTPGVLPVSN